MTSGPPLRRVVLGLGAGNDMQTAIRAATSLAAAVKSELLCLLVEQQDLLNLARLPFARAYGWGGLASTLTAKSIESHFNRMSRLAEEVLSQVCAEGNIAWQFRHPQGEIVSEVAAALEEGDLVLLDPRAAKLPENLLFEAARHWLAIASAVVIPPPSLRMRGPVLALGAAAATTARAIAEALGTKVEAMPAGEFDLYHGSAAAVVAGIDGVEPGGERDFLRRIERLGALAVLVRDVPG